MRIAIAAATAREMDAIREPTPPGSAGQGPLRLSYWTTGVGLLHATHALTARIRAERPGLVLQVGIGGAFDTVRHPVGSAACLARDGVADLGVREADGWRDVFEMGLTDPDTHPYRGGWLVNPHDRLLTRSGLAAATGVTVNRVSTDRDWIGDLERRLRPDIESMEGAALHYVCLMESVPFLQIRGVSNRVGERDKSAWQIAAALDSAAAALHRLLAILPENGHA
jgi:futalosine hydrolase